MTQLIRLCVASALLGVSPVATAGAQGQDPAPRPSREVRGQLGASINNAGLQNTLEVVWTLPTSSSSHPLLSGAHIAVGVTNALTPTQTRLGGWVEYSPLSILDLRAGIDPSAYFGTFNSLMGFDSYAEPFDKETRDARSGGAAGLSTRTYIAPTLKMKAGPLVGSASAELEWWRSSTDAAYFYEPTRDTLLRSDGDRMMTTTSVLMYQRAVGEGSLSVGGIHTLTKVFDADDNQIQRVGLIAIRELAGNRLGLPHPRVTVIVARYLDDPSKQNQWTGALAIGFRTGR